MKEIKDDTNKWKKYTMFLDWKNQYCQNYYTTQGNLQIQCNLYKMKNGIFHITKTRSLCRHTKGFPGSSAGKESTCNAGDPGSISGLGREPGEGIGYPLQYSWASLVAQMVKNLPAMQET